MDATGELEQITGRGVEKVEEKVDLKRVGFTGSRKCLILEK